MTRVSLLVNLDKPPAALLARRAVDWLRARSVTIQLDEKLSQAIDEPSLATPDDKLGMADLFVTLGGDGTILAAARLAAPHQTPILGVNLGRFGFIATTKPSDMEEGLTLFFDRRSLVEERMMIAGQVVRDDKVVSETFALNELSVHRPAESAMLNFGIFMDSHRVTAYPADGVIVATPTGSTAYSLSAGGPIVEPTMTAMIITAISPHSLGARPFVARPEALITLTLESDGYALLAADGQPPIRVQQGDQVKVFRAHFCTRLVTFRPDDFYTKLGQRLLYGVRVED